MQLDIARAYTESQNAGNYPSYWNLEKSSYWEAGTPSQKEVHRSMPCKKLLLGIGRA